MNQAVYANQIANFNVIDSLLINSSQLGASGIATNGNNYYSICNPTITVRVGQQNVYTTTLPAIVDASHLIGKTISNLDFSLTDQRGRPVNTNGEVYSFMVTYQYTL